MNTPILLFENKQQLERVEKSILQIHSYKKSFFNIYKFKLKKHILGLNFEQKIVYFVEK